MSQKQTLPCGSWKSPITADLILAGTRSLSEVFLDGEDVYWLESKPLEQGRTVVVRYDKGETQELTPAPFNVRSRVHEYGGGSYGVHEGTVYFVNFSDQRIYRQSSGSEVQALTPAGKYRYASFEFDPARKRLICVREDHSEAGKEPENTIVAVDLADGTNTVLVSGDDFYAGPRLSADGSRMCWVSWNHPNMPWDGTRLKVAKLRDNGRPGAPDLIAGREEESVFQPEWAPDGSLYFISDRSGYWNLYRYQSGEVKTTFVLEKEFGLPWWNLGMRTYSVISDEELLCAYNEKGLWDLARVFPSKRKLVKVETPFSEIGSVCAASGFAVFGGGASDQRFCLARLDFESGKIETLRTSSDEEPDREFLSLPETVEFPTTNEQNAYGLYYAPCPGRKAAAHRAHPRRSDGRRRNGPESVDPVLDEPRIRRFGCELQRQHRLRTGVSQAFGGRLGGARRGGLRERGLVSGEKGSGGRKSYGDQRRKRRGLHGSLRSDIP